MRKAVSITLAGVEDTERLGEACGRAVSPGTVIGLVGPLGAGKTSFVRGLARGMGIDEGYVVASPTFTLLQVYPCRGVELWHLDLYRIHGPGDLDSTGYRDGVGPGRVLAVEWADREPSCLPKDHILVELGYGDGGRVATIRATGAGNRKVAGRVMEALGARSARCEG